MTTTSDGPCIHHWMINDVGLGKCKFCNEARQFNHTGEVTLREAIRLAGDTTEIIRQQRRTREPSELDD